MRGVGLRAGAPAPARAGPAPPAAPPPPGRGPEAPGARCGARGWPLAAGLAGPLALRLAPRRRAAGRGGASASSAFSASAGGGARRLHWSEVKRWSEARLYRSMADFLQGIGGRCRFDSLRDMYPEKEYPKATEEFLRRSFDIKEGPKGHHNVVSLRTSAEELAEQVNFAAKRVAKQLFRLGGSADLHDITRRFGVSKADLLAHEDGKVFEASEGQLRLAGGARAVAAAAAAAGAVTVLPGRRRSPGDLLTSTGAATDAAAAQRLLLRIEGLLASAGDGALPARSVYAALGLRPTPALRRWFQRAGLGMSRNGELRVAEERLAFFRVRRGIGVAALLAEGGGGAPLAAVSSLVHRPPELARLEVEEKAVAASPAPAARPPGGGHGHRDYGGQAPGGAAGGLPEPLAMVIAAPPPWVEAWVREYFDVQGDAVHLPPRPAPLSRATGWSFAEEEAALMSVQEELRLRYGRAHNSVLTGCFQGVRLKWLRRFFDVTPYGEIVAKSVDRQTREAIAIAANALAAPGAYSAEDAFRDFGASGPWLRAFFQVNGDGGLELDADEFRAWRPPPKDSAPSPWSYAKLKAPRGYIRKGNGRYLPRKYGHSAGGILY